jgi:hypothetical protein
MKIPVLVKFSCMYSTAYMRIFRYDNMLVGRQSSYDNKKINNNASSQNARIICSIIAGCEFTIATTDT